MTPRLRIVTHRADMATMGALPLGRGNSITLRQFLATGYRINLNQTIAI